MTTFRSYEEQTTEAEQVAEALFKSRLDVRSALIFQPSLIRDILSDYGIKEPPPADLEYLYETIHPLVQVILDKARSQMFETIESAVFEYVDRWKPPAKVVSQSS